MNKILVLIALAALGVALVAAQEGDGYIQINNAEVIEVAAGQQPQVVVQFGNQGDALLSGVRVVCSIAEGEGTVSLVEDQIYPYSLETYALDGATVAFPEDEAGIDLIAGQNYNVAFNVLPEEDAQREVVCDLVSGGEVVGSASVTVQTPMDAAAQPEQTSEPELNTQALQITLSWDNDTDLDLFVVEPDGNVIFYGSPESATGGTLDNDANYPCGENLTGEEHIAWGEDAASTGTYRILAGIGEAGCDELDEADWMLTIRVDGQLIFEGTGEGLPAEQDSVEVVRFRFEDDGTAVILGMPIGVQAQAAAPALQIEQTK